MPKITDEPLEALQVRLFKKDLDALRRLYAGQFGVNRAIRTIVHSFVTQTEAQASAIIDIAEGDIDDILDKVAPLPPPAA